MAQVTISAAGMSDVVRGLEQGIETLRGAQSSLRATLDRFDLDTSRTATIGLSVDWALTELPGVRRRLALAQMLEGSDPTWPAGTTVFDESRVSTVDPAVALRDGQAAAAALREGRGKPDDALLAKLEAYQNDPYFASGFASGLSPSELADVVSQLSSKRAPADGFLDAAGLAERNAWYGRVLSGMSATLGTATRATGDLALPAGYTQSWVTEITAEVNGAQSPDGTGRVDHANAQGALLGSGGSFSLAFLGTVSEQVYDYERAFKQDHRGEVWQPRSGDPSTMFVVADANGQIVRDPMPGIMAALGKNPAAAQDFFSGGANVTVKIAGVDQVVSDRLAYLVQDRSWASDPTKGAGLGSALEAATTARRNQDGTGRISAELASQTFALIGDKTGRDGWKMPDGMRLGVANMLASYGADVYRARMSGGDDLGVQGWSMLGSGSLFPDDMPYGATTNAALVVKIIGTLGEDQGSFTPFMAGMFRASNLAMDTGLKRATVNLAETNAGTQFLDGVPLQDASASITNSATVIGWALNTGYGGDKADEAAQKKRMETVADALSLVSSLPFVPEIKPAWLKWGLDQAKERTLAEIKESAPSDAGTTYADLDSRAKNSLRDNVANLLLQNGYLSDEAIAGSKKNTGFAPYPAKAVTTSPSGVQTFKTDSKEYTEWMNISPLTTILATQVVGVYRDQWSVLQ